jgi:hypothetical protein
LPLTEVAHDEAIRENNGRAIVHVTYDESVNVGTGIDSTQVTRPLRLPRQATRMLIGYAISR